MTSWMNCRVTYAMFEGFNRKSRFPFRAVASSFSGNRLNGSFVPTGLAALRRAPLWNPRSVGFDVKELHSATC